MADALLSALIERCAATIVAHEAELTGLDQAIGDGDHGTNMKRGFQAIEAASGEIAAMPFGAALQKAGMTLVMSVGGASGPLYGSLLMAIGKAGDAVPTDAAEIVRRLAEGIDAVKKRGKSDVGAKTMLDVLVPVCNALDAAAGDPATASASARRAADLALEATRPMKATKGRASFLGDRSVGHLDPGARSTALLVNAVCDVVEGR